MKGRPLRVRRMDFVRPSLRLLVIPFAQQLSKCEPECKTHRFQNEFPVSKAARWMPALILREFFPVTPPPCFQFGTSVGCLERV